MKHNVQDFAVLETLREYHSIISFLNIKKKYDLKTICVMANKEIDLYDVFFIHKAIIWPGASKLNVKNVGFYSLILKIR